ncbi:MAG: hypothetical protein IPM37_13680 [Hahellaceae bacterium]|nr:hypothetical protein [Hahellaceae bacterium]
MNELEVPKTIEDFSVDWLTRALNINFPGTTSVVPGQDNHSWHGNKSSFTFNIPREYE